MVFCLHVDGHKCVLSQETLCIQHLLLSNAGYKSWTCMFMRLYYLQSNCIFRQSSVFVHTVRKWLPAYNDGTVSNKLTCYTECLQFELCSIVYHEAAVRINLSQLVRLTFKIFWVDPLSNLLDLSNVNWSEGERKERLLLTLLAAYTVKNIENIVTRILTLVTKAYFQDVKCYQSMNGTTYM